MNAGTSSAPQCQDQRLCLLYPACSSIPKTVVSSGLYHSTPALLWFKRLCLPAAPGSLLRHQPDRTLHGLGFCCGPEMCLNLNTSKASTGLVQEIKVFVTAHLQSARASSPQPSSAILNIMTLGIKLKCCDDLGVLGVYGTGFLMQRTKFRCEET